MNCIRFKISTSKKQMAKIKVYLYANKKSMEMRKYLFLSYHSITESVFTQKTNLKNLIHILKKQQKIEQFQK